MMHYRKADIEGLVLALCKHWGGQALDWLLVVDPNLVGNQANVELQVEIALGSLTQIITIPLVANLPRKGGRAKAHGTQSATEALAAVRRAAVQTLYEQCPANDIEPLLGYLRCCGIIIID